jgi:hypothetical protein
MRYAMVSRGHVKNGVVVLDGGVRLPEGLEVTVMAPDPPISPAPAQGPHSVLDIPTISLGTILRPLSSDEDLLEEMLEERKI